MNLDELARPIYRKWMCLYPTLSDPQTCRVRIARPQPMGAKREIKAHTAYTAAPSQDGDQFDFTTKGPEMCVSDRVLRTGEADGEKLNERGGGEGKRKDVNTEDKKQTKKRDTPQSPDGEPDSLPTGIRHGELTRAACLPTQVYDEACVIAPRRIRCRTPEGDTEYGEPRNGR